jgi:hypothetical protein
MSVNPAVSGVFISARLSPQQPFLRHEVMIRPFNKNLDTSVDPDWLSSASLSAGAGRLQTHSMRLPLAFPNMYHHISVPVEC